VGDTLAFPGDHPIATHRGQVPIRDLRPDDLLLGADGRYHPHDGVEEIHGPTHILAGDGHPAIEVLSSHEVVVRHRKDRHLGEPELVPVGDMRPSRWGDKGPTWATPTRVAPRPVPSLPVSSAELWWVAGRYLTSGRLRASRRGGPQDIVEFTAQEPEFGGLRQVLRPGRTRRGQPLVWQEERRGVESVFRVHHPALAGWLREHIGDSVRERGVPMWLLGTNRGRREAFLGGALSPHWHGGHLSRPAHQRPTVPAPNHGAAVGLRMLGATLDHRIDLATKGLLGRWHLSWLREGQGHHSDHTLHLKERPAQSGRALWHRIGTVRRGALNRKLYAVKPKSGTVVVGGMLFGAEGAPRIDPRPRQRPETVSGGGGGGGGGRKPSPGHKPIAPVIPAPTGRGRRGPGRQEPERQPEPVGEMPTGATPGTAREVLDRILAAPSAPTGAAERVPVAPREPVLAQGERVPAEAACTAAEIPVPVMAQVPQEIPSTLARTAAQEERIGDPAVPAMLPESYAPVWAHLPERAREAAVRHLQGHEADAVIPEPVRSAVEAFRALPPTDQYAVLTAAERGPSEAARVQVGTPGEEIQPAVEQPSLPGVEIPRLPEASVGEPRTISELLDVARGAASREPAIVRGAAGPAVTDRTAAGSRRELPAGDVAVRREAGVPGVPPPERADAAAQGVLSQSGAEGDVRDVPVHAQGGAPLDQSASELSAAPPVYGESQTAQPRETPYAEADLGHEPGRALTEEPAAVVEARHSAGVAYPAQIRVGGEPDIIWNGYEAPVEERMPGEPQVLVDGVPARAELISAASVPVAVEGPPALLRLPAPQEAISPVFFGAEDDSRAVPVDRGDWAAVVRRAQGAEATRDVDWRERVRTTRPALDGLASGSLGRVAPAAQPGHGGWGLLAKTRIADAAPPRVLSAEQRQEAFDREWAERQLEIRRAHRKTTGDGADRRTRRARDEVIDARMQAALSAARAELLTKYELDETTTRPPDEMAAPTQAVEPSERESRASSRPSVVRGSLGDPPEPSAKHQALLNYLGPDAQAAFRARDMDGLAKALEAERAALIAQTGQAVYWSSQGRWATVPEARGRDRFGDPVDATVKAGLHRMTVEQEMAALAKCMAAPSAREVDDFVAAVERGDHAAAREIADRGWSPDVFYKDVGPRAAEIREMLGEPVNAKPDLTIVEPLPHAHEPSGLSDGMHDAHAPGPRGRAADVPPADHSGGDRAWRERAAEQGRAQREVARNLADQRENQRHSAWIPENLTAREAGLYHLAFGAHHQKAWEYSETLRAYLAQMPEAERAAQIPGLVDAMRDRLHEEWDGSVGNRSVGGTRDYPMPPIPADYVAGLGKPLQHAADRALERTAADVQRDTAEARQDFISWADDFEKEHGREPSWSEVDQYLGLETERGLVGPVLTGITAATMAFTNAGAPPPHHLESRPLDPVAIEHRVDQGLVSIYGTFGKADHAAEGTGVVVTPDGKILTAYHVVHGDTIQRVDPGIQVVDDHGRSRPAVVLAENRRADVALLQAEGMDGPMVPAHLRDSDTVQRGEPMEVIGDSGRADPGVEQHTVHAGHVTKLHDDVVVDYGTGVTRTVPDDIYTDAQSVPGDSGGPMADAESRVVGITNAGTDGPPYGSGATPINSALRDLWTVRPAGEAPEIEEPTAAELGAAQEGVAPPVEVGGDGRVVEHGAGGGPDGGRGGGGTGFTRSGGGSTFTNDGLVYRDPEGHWQSMGGKWTDVEIDERRDDGTPGPGAHVGPVPPEHAAALDAMMGASERGGTTSIENAPGSMSVDGGVVARDVVVNEHGVSHDGLRVDSEDVAPRGDDVTHEHAATDESAGDRQGGNGRSEHQGTDEREEPNRAEAERAAEREAADQRAADAVEREEREAARQAELEAAEADIAAARDAHDDLEDRSHDDDHVFHEEPMNDTRSEHIGGLDAPSGGHDEIDGGHDDI
jgi:S1-C subfamily serine protease